MGAARAAGRVPTSSVVCAMTLRAGIVITTRNRERDLLKLFSLLAGHPRWSAYPLWVHDDASDDVTERYWEAVGRHATFLLRSPRRCGLIANRNVSNASAPFDLIFSLDDDSCFVDADGPELAVSYMEENPRVAALSFPLVDGFEPPPARDLKPYACYSYVGCAHLIRRDVFVELQGYRSDFIHQGEEGELCSRLWAAGYEVHAFPACRVYHWVSPEARSQRRMGFFGPRNRVWSHLMHTPARALPLEILRTLASYAKLSLRTGIPHVHLKGFLSGLRHGLSTLGERQPLPASVYKRLTSLPESARTP